MKHVALKSTFRRLKKGREELLSHSVKENFKDFYFFIFKKRRKMVTEVLQIGNEVHLPLAITHTVDLRACLFNRNNNCSPILFHWDSWLPFRRLAPPFSDSLIGSNRQDPAPRHCSLNCCKSPVGKGDRCTITKQSIIVHVSR